QCKKSEPLPRRRPKKIIIPRRAPSIVIPPRRVVYITADKTTCTECPCYPKEEPYMKNKKINPCRKSPPTLYDLAADAVDGLNYPPALLWSEQQVAEWVAGLGLPQYQGCFLMNHIDGLRLMFFENPSRLPEVNIHDFEHILRRQTLRRYKSLHWVLREVKIEEDIDGQETDVIFFAA
ncbi:uncharacterized protein LOC119192804, partial [Manduca sexta]|uniref:uncharacterized protein LOC119192804 n=1 Tax=Manduca sexta TaxID=7130 RepID=UPI0018900187